MSSSDVSISMPSSMRDSYSSSSSLEVTHVDLDKRLSKEVFGTFWGKRIIRGIYESGENCKRVATLTCFCVGTILFGMIVYFSGEGVYQVLKYSSSEMKSGKPTPSIIGHAGEWIAEIILDTIVYSSESYKLMRQGDFEKIKRIYKDVIVDKKNSWDISMLYQHVLQTFETIGRQSFSPKNFFDQKLQVLQLMKKIDIQEQPCKELDIDRKLRRVFQKINRDLNKELGARTYFKRFYRGVRDIGKKHGRFSQFKALVSGVCLPISLGALSAITFYGMGLIGRDVYKASELTLIGHISEWFTGGVGFLYMGRYLNKWTITSQGDLVTARQVMVRHIETYKEGDKKLYKRLISVANAQLDHYANGCMFTNLPSTYRFS